MQIKPEKSVAKNGIIWIITIVVFLILGATLFLGTFFINVHKKWLLTSTNHLVNSFAIVLAQEYLAPTDFADENFTNNKDKFQVFFNKVLQNKEIKQINLFNSSSQVFSSNPKYEFDAEERERVKEVLQNEIIVQERRVENIPTEIETDEEKDVMEIYVPLKNSDGKVYGILELYHSLSSVIKYLDQTINIVRASLFGAFSVLALFVIIWSLFFSRRLRKQSEYLVEQNWRIIQTQGELKKNIDLKNLFISIVNHDLKHPLTIIRFAVDAIRGQTNDQEIIKHLDKIDQTTVETIKMVEGAMIFTQLEDKQYTKQKKTIDLVELINKILADFQNRSYEFKHISIRFNQPTNPFPFNALPILENAIMNIVDNAIKYGGNTPKLVIDLVDQDKHYLLSVADNGPGILDQYKTKVFLRYHRVDKKGISGNGLGLAIVKHVIELHNGRVWIENNPGGGSIFKIELPKEA